MERVGSTGITSATDSGTPYGGSAGTGSGLGTSTGAGTCASCGQPLGGSSGLEQFLGKLGISEDMITNLKSSMQTIDVEEYLNRLNEALLDRLQNEGEAFVSNAVIRGQYVLRACIVNINTTEADVEAVPGIVARVGRAVDRELRR